MKREIGVGLLVSAILAVLAFTHPDFFRGENLRDIALANAPVLIAAIGTTIVILAGEIDISIGSQFAVLSILAGILAKAGLPAPAVLVCAAAAGAVLGGVNGALVALAGIPSIIVTLATMMIWREGLRWVTEGAWVQGLPDAFQWFGLSQGAGGLMILLGAAAIFAAASWALENIPAGRMVYATGSDREAARLAGLHPRTVLLVVFALNGALAGIAAVASAVRFQDVPANAGIGLELKCITAAVIGGTAITGGKGSLWGTLLGVVLLGIVATGMIFAGVSPYWERAIEGAIIIAAVCSERIANAKVRQQARLGAAA